MLDKLDAFDIFKHEEKTDERDSGLRFSFKSSRRFLDKGPRLVPGPVVFIPSCMAQEKRRTSLGPFFFVNLGSMLEKIRRNKITRLT
jgi:hypothetical protein